MLFILRVPFVCFLGQSKNITVQKKSYIQRKHLEIHSDIKTIIILSDVIPSGELVLLGGGIPGVVHGNTGGGTDMGQVKHLG